MTEAQVTADQGHVQGQVQIGTESDVISAVSMITLQKIVLHQKEDSEMKQIQQMFNLDEEQTSLKTLATDTYDSRNKI